MREDSVKDIAGYNGKYGVTKDGRVYSRNASTFLKPREHNGYLRVALYKNGVSKHLRIHRLVADAYIPNPHHSKEVNHKDKDRQNNDVSNLEWCTRQQNTDHMRSFVLTEHYKQAAEKLVKLLLEKDTSVREIADASGLSPNIVLSIKHSSLFK